MRFLWLDAKLLIDLIFSVLSVFVRFACDVCCGVVWCACVFVIVRVMFLLFNVFVCLDSELLCDDALFVCWLLLLLCLRCQ